MSKKPVDAVVKIGDGGVGEPLLKFLKFLLKSILGIFFNVVVKC